MKKSVCVLFAIIFFSFFVMADFSLHNYSISKTYPYNQILSGSLNVTLDSYPSNGVLTTNHNQESTILDFLDDNAAIYDCSPEDCTIGYQPLDSSTSLTIDLSKGEYILGFFVNGSDVDINQLDFEVDSLFEPGEVSPLRFIFFEDPMNEWKFQYFTEDEYYEPDYGYYRDYNANLDYSLGGWTYCNDLIFYETDTVLIGADIYTNNASGFVEIQVFNDLGTPLTGGSNKLLFNPQYQNGVKFTSPDDTPFSNAHYYVCVRAYNGTASQFQIYTDELTGFDSNGDNNGMFSGFNYQGEFFDYNASISQKRASYSIFIQEAYYAGSDKLETQAVDFTDNLELADNYLTWKYDNDCTSGCFLPFRVSGIPQNLTISDVTLSYSTEFGAVGNPDLKVYELRDVPSLIDYSGILDLSVLGFKMNQSGQFKLFLDDEEILEESISINAAPLIKGIYPLSVPAGVSARLFAEVDYNVSDPSLTYEWDFGDGTSMTTFTPNVTHKYTNLSQYSVKLVVRDGNLSNSYQTTITTVNPREYVDVIYQQMELSLNESLIDLDTFPEWQRSVLRNALGILDSEDQLRRIKRQLDQAYTDQDYVDIAITLNTLDIPRRLFVSSSYSYNLPLTDDAQIESFATYTGESLSTEHTHDEYVDAVVRWQDLNMEYDVSISKISLLRTSGIIEDVMLVYLLRAENKFGGDAYLVLEKSRDELYFSGLAKEPKSESGLSIFQIDEGDSLTLEFYTLGVEEVSFFGTPEIRYLVLEADVNENCNFNLICEDGEDYNVCRSDCKPVSRMIWYIILLFLLGLVLYTLLQMWYLKHYENQLFEDKNRLHNLLMYVTAAQNKGLSREEIKKSLREKGWTLERIDFVVRKANGERIGLYEIIPISKFMAKSRKDMVAQNPKLGQHIPSPRGPMPPSHGMPPRSAPGSGSHPMPPKGPSGAPMPSKGPSGSSMPPRKPSGATQPGQQKGGNINKGDNRPNNNKENDKHN